MAELTKHFFPEHSPREAKNSSIHEPRYHFTLRPTLLVCKGIFKMADRVEEEPDLPEEVTESLESFHEALGKVEDVFKPLLETSVDDLKEKVGRCSQNPSAFIRPFQLFTWGVYKTKTEDRRLKTEDRKTKTLIFLCPTRHGQAKNQAKAFLSANRCKNNGVFVL